MKKLFVLLLALFMLTLPLSALAAPATGFSIYDAATGTATGFSTATATTVYGGTLTWDPATGTLTLDGCTIDGGIEVTSGDMILRVLGTNSVTGGAGRYGGRLDAMYLYDGVLTIEGTGAGTSTIEFRGSDAANGFQGRDGIFIYDGTLEVTDVTVRAYGGDAVDTQSGMGIDVNGDMTVTRSIVTAQGGDSGDSDEAASQGMTVGGDLTVTDGSAVEGSAGINTGGGDVRGGVYADGDITVSGGSTLEGSTSGADTYGVLSWGSITVTGDGSSLRGVGAGTTPAGEWGGVIAASGGINGLVSSPSGARIEQHVFDWGETLYSVLQNGVAPEAARIIPGTQPPAPAPAPAPQQSSADPNPDTGESFSPALFAGIAVLAAAGLAYAGRRLKARAE